MSARPEQARLSVPVSDRDHSTGPANAPVTLVEYGDFECPYCGQAHPIVRKIRERFGPKLRFVFRNFPLREIHPHAEQAAESAEAAATKGKFWEMHDSLFEHQRALDAAHLVGYTAALGLDPAWMAEVLAGGEFAEAVREDFLSGVRSGVNGTPTFFINGVRHDGSWSFEGLVEAIEAALPKHR